MSDSLQTNSQKRWISNAMLLVDTLDSLKNVTISGTDNPAFTTEGALDAIITKMVEILTSNIDIISNSEDAEIQEFYLTCKNDEDLTISNEKIQKYIEMQTNCLGYYSRKISSKLIKHTNNNGVITKKPLHESLLGLALKTNYLNRIICIAAEELAEEKEAHFVGGDGNNWTFKENIADVNESIVNDKKILLNIYINAQRVRSSNFGNCFNEDITGKSLKNVSGIFKKAQAKDDCPFNKKVHRRRQQTPGTASNPESYFLSVGAGGSITNIDSESTLGLVQRALKLPERCDISGTTTDAIGAALTLCNKVDTFGPHTKGSAPIIYVLSCITAMCLLGHHSLSEMGAAASLWSLNKYNPLKSTAFIHVIYRLKRLDNTRPTSQINDGRRQIRRILKNIDETSNQGWHSQVWLSLAGKEYENVIDSWEFNDSNWRTWKAFASINNTKP